MMKLRVSAVVLAKNSIPVKGASAYRQFAASSLLARRSTLQAGVTARTRGLILEPAEAEEGAMGQVIDLAQRRDAVRRKTRRREPLRAQLFFDLACPFTYLATERVERAFSHVTWTA